MSQSHPAWVYADRIQEREWMLKKLKIMNSKVCDLSVKVNKAEELKRIRDKKEETRKRRASPAWGGGGASSKHIKAMLMIGPTMICSQAANELPKTTG